LAMQAIADFGSEEQRAQWLPALARGEAIGAFGLTEWDFGSDPSGIRTAARRDGSDYLLHGTKAWITNGTIADVAIVWARLDGARDDSRDGTIGGFLVPAGTRGFSARAIERKLSLRASVTAELVLDDVRLPGEARLPGAQGLGAALHCLNSARYGIVWGAVGAARACFEAALAYAKTRVQFERPIAAFQLTQEKLVEMALDLGKAQLVASRLGRLGEAAALRPAQVSFGKLNNVRAALGVARTARTILGASGITLDYPIVRHMNNLESVLTYEGTSEIHTLILGQALTGFAAFGG
ncbi:MAG: acyl-CoA dehydrogenase family protein, partial [Vulcanimicrobiaceae bacterium]